MSVLLSDNIRSYFDRFMQKSGSLVVEASVIPEDILLGRCVGLPSPVPASGGTDPMSLKKMRLYGKGAATPSVAHDDDIFSDDTEGTQMDTFPLHSTPSHYILPKGK